MRPLLPGLLAACLAIAPLHATTLRAQTTLDSEEVHLSDLFGDAGPQANRRLGSSPAPGNQLIIEAAQLAAIARQFDIDWRPTSGGEHVVLDRPGRPLPREDVIAALRLALPRSGAAADCDIDLPAFAPPMIPASATPQIDAEQIDYDPASGRFAAMLVINAAHMTTLHARVTGRADEMLDLPVTSHRVLPGEQLGAADIRPGRVRSYQVRAEMVQTMADAIGMQSRRSLAAGQPIAAADLQRPALVRKNATVVITLNGPGMSVSAVGQALDSGPLGGHIRVLNPASRAVIQASITGPDQVSVDIGAARPAASRLAAR